MRNNQDRLLGAGSQASSNPFVAQASTFNFVVPTELVELPSKGKYYPPEHPLHNRENVEIRQMTAKEEDILANKNFIENGIVLDKLIESVLLDKSINPKSLLITDKNAILLRTRISGYGPEYDVSALCAKCLTRNDLEVNLESIIKIDEATLPEDSVLSEDGLVRITLPKTKWVVAVKPISSSDQERLEKILEGRKKHNLELNTLTETMRSFTVSIDGAADDGMVYQYFANMPASDSRYLRNVYEKCFPRVSTLADLKCSNCSAETVVEVPFTVNFFWPN